MCEKRQRGKYWRVRERSRKGGLMIYAGVIASIFAVELWIKGYIERKKKEGDKTPVLGGHIFIRKHHNEGACLNFGNLKLQAVAVISLFFTAMMLGVFVATMFTRGNAFLKTGLSLLLGGAFSNTYDRLRRKYVVDYFSFSTGFQWLDRIIFNISDFCIAIGAAMTAMVAVLR